MSKPLPVKSDTPLMTDDHLGKEVQIKCEGASTVAIDKLQNFQGNLKTLSEEAYQRLKKSILELGFSFPVAAWKDRNLIRILDAHQRVDVLKRMRAEGYVIPPLPVIWVEAADEQEAAKKLLAATSQYGEIQVDGLHSFMQQFSLNMEDIKSTFKFPEVDFDSFQLTYFHEPVVLSGSDLQTSDPKVVPGAPPGVIMSQNTPPAANQWNGMPEFVQEDKTAFRSIIVHFHDQQGVDTFARETKQTISDKTRMLWYPEIIIETYADKRYGNFES